jgi:glyoxylase-like metal-dependent hydrolase (beta-lactamase superfamily II)
MNIVNVGYRSTNYYVLVSPTTHLLVDGGWPETLPQLRHQLRLKGLALHTIHYLLCTHYHPDHAGLVQEIVQEGVQLIVVDEQRSVLPHSITLHHAISLSTAASRPFLKQCDINGEIIWTPGHSDDSISLVLDTGIAFTGDLQPPLDTTDPQHQMLAESWYKLEMLGVKQIYPGHGPVRQLGGSTS